MGETHMTEEADAPFEAAKMVASEAKANDPADDENTISTPWLTP